MFWLGLIVGCALAPLLAAGAVYVFLMRLSLEIDENPQEWKGL